MRNAWEIRSHLRDDRLKALIEHLLQVIVLPPGLRHVMVGEDLPSSGCKKSRTKNIQVYFRSAAGQAQKRVVMFVSLRLAISRHLGIVQSQSGCVVAKGKHNMDKTDARFVRFDDRLCHLPLGFELLKARLNS